MPYISHYELQAVRKALQSFKSLAEYCLREGGPCDHEAGHCVCRETGDLCEAIDAIALLGLPIAESKESDNGEASWERLRKGLASYTDADRIGPEDGNGHP